MDAFAFPAIILAVGLSMAAWQWAIRSGNKGVARTNTHLADLMVDVSKLTGRVEALEAKAAQLERDVL